ncbi:MAG TPA: Stp1/IreP family PP2C-type Ser/Thr phosphatase [Acidimicrobiales bacterium]
MTVLSGAAATDVGRVRQINEDRYLVGEGLYAVADGVGGHQAGEVAAQASVEALASNFTERTTEGLVAAVQEASRAVWRLAQENTERRGMGTTLTVLALVEQEGEDVMAIANVGDSRAYLFQRGDLVQVTEDHSLVEELVREGQLTPEEAQVHPQRSIITRALGMEAEVQVDAWTLTPYAGDRIVLCSDGLTNEVTTDKIASVLRHLSDPQEAARELVRQARANGGNDNITVVVVDVVDDGGKAEKASEALAADPPTTAEAPVDSSPTVTVTRRPDPTPPPRPGAPTGSTGSTATATRTRPPVTTAPPPSGRFERPRRLTWRVVLFLACVVGVLGIVAASVAWYARSAYFVGIDGDQVAIFRGRPGGFLWFDPTLVDRKELPVSDVLPAKLDELRAGKEEPSKADADRYVNNLRQEAAERRAATTTTTTTTPPNTLPGGSAAAPTTTRAGPP